MDELMVTLDEYAIGLRQLREQEEAKLEELRNRVRATEANIDRIGRAIRELTGEAAVEKVEAAAEPTQPKIPQDHSSLPSAETIDRVLWAIRNNGDGFTYSEIITQSGLSRDTVRRAVSELRAREVIRLAGARGRQRIFKLMPDWSESEVASDG
jgi:Fic family protein